MARLSCRDWVLWKTSCNARMKLSVCLVITAVVTIAYIYHIVPVTHSEFHKTNLSPQEVPESNLPRPAKVFGRKMDLNDETESVEETAGDITKYSLPVSLPHKIVHIDLKGAPPLVSYYEHLFDVLARLGATGVLMEYEDMFPYWGPLAALRAGNAYTKEDIRTILEAAKLRNLEVIPLVQTFGHLEFALKLVEFSHLREVPEYPQVICPTQNATLPFVFEMLQQVHSLHPESKYLHIGSDEVYHIGECSLCQGVMFDLNWSKVDLFLNHVTAVARFVKSTFKVQPMMWDDEFRHLDDTHFEKAVDLRHLVEVVVWHYTPNVGSQLSSNLLERYFRSFHGVWIATAFKGASGSDQYLTPVDYHLRNHQAWVALLESLEGENRNQIRGVMLTGWQRYDHFSVLCELLPVGLPSLSVNLLYLKYGVADARLYQHAAQSLGCSNTFLGSFFASLSPDRWQNCRNFPGFPVYQVAYKFHEYKERLQLLYNHSVIRGWMADYNGQHVFSSPAHVHGIVPELSSARIELDLLIQDVRQHFQTVYDHCTIQEWIETLLLPLKRGLDGLWRTKDKLLDVRHWPRRPLPTPET